MILRGDCLLRLKELPDNSVDSVVTDPPYGLSFMGKKWDYDVPSVDIWKEALRVLKPGGHLLAFGGTRTYHRLVVNIEDAGFEIRDQIQWIYGSGFPKSHNIKEGAFKGFGTALKPANEPICVARKPLIGTVAANVESWGTGAINIDASRIEFTSEADRKAAEFGSKGGAEGWGLKPGAEVKPTNPQGRWPANVIFDEEAGKLLDEQSGTLKSGTPGIRRKPHDTTSMSGRLNLTGTIEAGIGDSGGASRFFYCAKASKSERNAGLEGMPEVTTDDGRQKSIDNAYQRGETKRANHHPTVKPLKLMEYLIRLVTPPNGTVLDCFAGSGTTLLAAKRLGFKFIGIELSDEYAEIAEKRIVNG